MKSVEEILSLPDFQERVIVYYDEAITYKDFIQKHARVQGNAIILDLRNVEKIPSGNRFIEYTLFPEQNISVRLTEGKEKKFVMISVGHSIINRTSKVDVGSMLLKYGGGGHQAVGTCQVIHDKADETLKEILKAINS